MVLFKCELFPVKRDAGRLARKGGASTVSEGSTVEGVELESRGRFNFDLRVNYCYLYNTRIRDSKYKQIGSN